MKHVWINVYGSWNYVKHEMSYEIWILEIWYYCICIYICICMALYQLKERTWQHHIDITTHSHPSHITRATSNKILYIPSIPSIPSWSWHCKKQISPLLSQQHLLFHHRYSTAFHLAFHYVSTRTDITIITLHYAAKHLLQHITHIITSAAATTDRSIDTHDIYHHLSIIPYVLQWNTYQHHYTAFDMTDTNIQASITTLHYPSITTDTEHYHISNGLF